MFCTKCGAQINDNAYVCIKCGVLVHKEPAKVGKPGTVSFVLGIIAISIAGLLAFVMLGISGDLDNIDGMSLFFVYMFCLLPLGIIDGILGLIGFIFGVVHKRTSGIILNAISIAIGMISVLYPVIFV